MITRRSALSFATTSLVAANAQARFAIPASHLVEEENIPPFWVSTAEEVRRFLDTKVRTGRVAAIGQTAGGREIRAVFYGDQRRGKGTSTFSGALGFRDVRAYLGPDWKRTVYWCVSAVHGGEFEGIMGAVNLLAVLETGTDLRGKRWPALVEAAGRVGRIVVIPITNVDGRVRVPLRMLKFQGTDHTLHEYFNTGAKPDGSIIGWPQCKEHIPLDFRTTQFPGGYPNDAGVNIQHDDFMENPQPETRALYRLATAERPDLILNMHTGANFLHPLRPSAEPVLTPVFDELYRRIMTPLTESGLQRSDNVAETTDPARERAFNHNLDTALNLHCGALSVTVESPAFDFNEGKRNGQPFFHSPENLLDAQMLTHQEALRYLADTGGRVAWTTPKG
ncbi:MAG: hypothetical protein KIT83_21200 [Bryobacterales bacterium]|nr:hypothetical protein [Bryobacterales bacterium]